MLIHDSVNGGLVFCIRHLPQDQCQHKPPSCLSILPIVEVAVVRHDLPVEMETLDCQINKHIVLPAHFCDLVQEVRVAPHTETNVINQLRFYLFATFASQGLEILNDGDKWC